jgi:hypothetical protein
MEFTFGIITDGTNDERIEIIINSIRKQQISMYEIIIVGNSNVPIDKDIRILSFDETIKSSWITRKKNIIVQEARYENIVLLHDYVVFNEGWYKGFSQFGNDFSICVNKIQNLDGSRYNDFALFLFFALPIHNNFTSQCLLPYNFQPTENTNKITYVSGTYYIIKKTIALQYPLDESKGWCESEDIDLSYSLTKDNYIIKCNPYSTVSFLKQKQKLHFMNEITEPILIEKLHNLTTEDAEVWQRISGIVGLFSRLQYLKDIHIKTLC